MLEFEGSNHKLFINGEKNDIRSVRMIRLGHSQVLYRDPFIELQRQDDNTIVCKGYKSPDA